jgi:cellulose biosynthesis protein BcsQ
LISADYLIIPSDLKPFANQGLINVKEFVKGINSFKKQLRKSPLEILGVLPSKISTNNKFMQYTLKTRIEKVVERYGIDVFDTVIYERDDLAKCSEKVLEIGEMEVADPISVIDYKPNSLSAQEFESLVKEVFNKIGMVE